jgi:phage terminase Nu1 subunit (DNA packaging protein)
MNSEADLAAERQSAGVNIPKDARVSARTLGAILKITKQRVNQLASKGVLQRSDDKLFDLAGALEGYCRYQVEVATDRARLGSNSIDLLKDAKAEEIERKLALQLRNLISLSEATGTFDLVTHSFLTNLSELPAMIANDPRERQRIAVIIDSLRSRLSTDFGRLRSRLQWGV